MVIKHPYILAGLSAFLLWLGWPPINFATPILLVALVPMFFGLEMILKSNRQKKGKAIFRTSFLAFLIWNTAAVYWIYNAISAYNSGTSGAITSIFVSLIPYALGPLLLAFACWLAYKVRSYVNRLLGWIAFVMLFIAMEYLQQSWDLAFPWMTLGNGFAGMHQLVQWYDVTGVYGGSLWILTANILVFESIVAFRSRQSRRSRLLISGATVLVVAMPITYSLTKYESYIEVINPSNVVVVQPNIDPYKKFGIISPMDQVNTLTMLSDSAAKPNTEFFIWPETAIPNYAEEDGLRSNREFLAAQQFLAKYPNGTILTGMETKSWYQDEATLSARYVPEFKAYIDNFNSAVQIENSGQVSTYHKSKLVPGAEKMPFPKFFAFLKPVFAQLGGSVGGWGWQENPEVFYAQSGIGTVPVICYESLWGDWIGQAVREGAQFITIITNDGWWGNTSGKDQHLLYAKLRAIEMRRYVVRSANTGISAIIDQRGDIVKRTSWWTRTALNGNINLNSDITAYARYGDVIAKLASLGAALFALFLLVRIWIPGESPEHEVLGPQS